MNSKNVLVTLALLLSGACTVQVDPKACTTGDCAVEETDRPSNGTDGTDGDDGLASLVDIDSAEISDCPFGGLEIKTGLDNDRDGILDSGEIDNTEIVCFPEPAVQPPLGTPEICDGIDNDRNDGTEVGGTPDGIDESIGRVYGLFITSSIEPSEPTSRRQLCVWGNATDIHDPDTVEDWIGCAQPGTWDMAGDTQIRRWQLGDLFPIDLVMRNFDCEAVRQGVQPGGTLWISMETPGDRLECDTFSVIYLNWDGSPATPICSL